MVWNFPDAIPQHREPLYSTRPTWSPSTRRTTTRRRSGACRRSTRRVQQKTQGHVAKKFPLILTSGPPGRIRGRRRGDPLQPVARRAAAGDVRRDQPEGRRRPRHPQRRVRSGSSRRPARAQRARRMVTERVGPTPSACRSTSPAAGRARTCCSTTRRAPRRRARRGGQHRHDVRLRQRHDDAGDQDHDLPASSAA